MIVISGALVLVALVLLIIGLVSTSLGFVYASIAVSVVSFVFLLVGILQRRGEQVPEPATADVTSAGSSDVEGVTAIIPSSRAVADPPAAPEPAADAAPVSGQVLVVAGRPRYHVGGCRYLTGKDADEVDVQAARDEGFTACGVCKPDAALAEAAATTPAEAVPLAAPAEESPAAEATVETAPPAPAKKAPAKRATKAPAKTATRAAKAPAKAPSKAAAAAAASTPAAASAAAKPGRVVVIPDRGKFHKPDCRFVRDAADAQEMTKAQAARQGYDACGVCKP